MLWLNSLEGGHAERSEASGLRKRGQHRVRRGVRRPDLSPPAQDDDQHTPSDGAPSLCLSSSAGDARGVWASGALGTVLAQRRVAEVLYPQIITESFFHRQFDAFLVAAMDGVVKRLDSAGQRARSFPPFARRSETLQSLLFCHALQVVTGISCVASYAGL